MGSCRHGRGGWTAYAVRLISGYRVAGLGQRMGGHPLGQSIIVGDELAARCGASGLMVRASPGRAADQMR
jgi:hypothetical protein